MFDSTTSVQTRKISCQYPIMAIHDLSSTHYLNVQNNSWTVLQEFPTNEQIQSASPPDKLYVAALWARDEEEIVFSAKFGRGSHMNISWSLETDGNDAYTASDDCKTQDGSKPAFDPDIAFQADANHWCVFPFRYNNTLFYGCSNFSLSGDTTTICATEIDEDYNAQKVGICNDYCHIQGKQKAINRIFC